MTTKRLTIHRCSCIPKGTRFYLRGGELLGESKPEDRALYASLGVRNDPPAGTDAVALAHADFDEFMAELEPEGMR